MRTTLRRASILLYAGLSAFLIWFGATYATVQDILWFHAAAAPDSAHEQIRPLYFALMNLIGGSSFALGALGAYVVFGPLRQGAPWAASALAAAFAIAFITAAVTAEELSATGAPTSWHIMGVLLALTATAYLAHIAARRASIMTTARA